ncbi:MAG: septal ring lytic transglycosylase RlpA family protein [Synergistales bacterium]|nr:septal ring lytic transglycosylase RlpA family protein [Synergistales bacterium]
MRTTKAFHLPAIVVVLCCMAVLTVPTAAFAQVVLEDRGEVVALRAEGYLVGTFPASVKPQLETGVEQLRRHFRRGIPISAFHVRNRSGQWGVFIHDHPILPALPQVCTYHNTPPRLMASIWLSRLYTAYAMRYARCTRETMISDSAVTEGKVSWYGGPRWNGNRTASGEVFDDKQLTAAARDLPFNTLVQLTSPQTGKSVTVRITDRFFRYKGRLFDISRSAAELLDIKGHGVARVRVRVLGKLDHLSSP